MLRKKQRGKQNGGGKTAGTYSLFRRLPPALIKPIRKFFPEYRNIPPQLQPTSKVVNHSLLFSIYNCFVDKALRFTRPPPPDIGTAIAKNSCYMNIDMPAIVLGVVHQQGIGVVPSRCAETKSANQFSPASANNTADSGSEATTTDNNSSDATNRTIGWRVQGFCQVYREGIKATAAEGASQNTETQKPSVTKKMILESKDGCELAQALVGLEASRPSSSIKCAAETAENKLVLTIDSKNQAAGKTVLTPVFAGPLIANSSVGESKNNNEASASGETVVSSKYLANQVIAKKAAEILTDGSKTATNNEMSTMADKPAGADNQKTPVNTGLLANQNKIFDESGLDKSAILVKKPNDSKAAADQQAVSSMPELAESSRGKDKDHVADSVLNDSLLKKLNSEQIISISKTKDGGNSSTNNSNFEDNSPKTFKQIFSVNGTQYSAAEQSSPAASASKMASTASQSDVSTSVGRQIQESIHSSLKQGEQQITIRLNPPELGKVSIQFHQQDGQLVGLLEVSRAQTRAEIQQALPQIIQNLAESGIQVKRLEVMLTNQQEQQGFRDPSLASGADSWSGQRQTEANSDSYRSNAGWVETDEWLTNYQSYASFIEPSILITGGSVNMLV